MKANHPARAHYPSKEGEGAPAIVGFRSTSAVALTFDDGPDPECTPRLFRMLERHGVHCTFFVLGQRAALYPEIIHEMHGRGHEVANHTWDHPSMPLVGTLQRRQQLVRSHATLGRLDSGLFRPPYGHFDRATFDAANGLGYSTVMWSGHARDWERHAAANIEERMLRSARPGSIFLLHDRLHDGFDSKAQSREHVLEGLDAYLRQATKCWTFITLGEALIRFPPVYRIFPSNISFERRQALLREDKLLTRFEA